ncbi:MAG: aminoacyl-tRNA hydrolase [Ignavibacteriales bacterium]|nr:aminoacyl-tRNA hydrolase [Ignavibacteriales bacterium]
MHLLVGLGNPGRGYRGTRHNIGFDVIDRLADKLSIPLRAGKGEYLIGSGSVTTYEIGLVQPLTFMNNSGEAVLDIRDRFDIPLDRFLIICDDFQLPLGHLRLRPEGSDGGHNGLYSIIYHLKSTSFPRLRCGIASDLLPPDKSLASGFVLDSFTAAEAPLVDDMLTRAVDASLSFIVDGLEKTMNRYNQKPSL